MRSFMGVYGLMSTCMAHSSEKLVKGDVTVWVHFRHAPVGVKAPSVQGLQGLLRFLLSISEGLIFSVVGQVSGRIVMWE